MPWESIFTTKNVKVKQVLQKITGEFSLDLDQDEQIVFADDDHDHDSSTSSGKSDLAHLESSFAEAGAPSSVPHEASELDLEPELSLLPMRRRSRQDETGVNVPASLLLVSLIDEFLRPYAMDANRRRLLFHSIAERLHKVGILPRAFASGEFSSLRYQTKVGFEELISASAMAVHSSIKHGELPALTLPKRPEEVLGLGGAGGDPGVPLVANLKFPSRYREEFVELARLGRGGFGQVCAARCLIDDKVYAVKQVKLKRPESVSHSQKVVREVKTLARLKHVNVVGYHAAWLDYEPEVEARHPSLKEESGKTARYSEYENAETRELPGEPSDILANSRSSSKTGSDFAAGSFKDENAVISAKGKFWDASSTGDLSDIVEKAPTNVSGRRSSDEFAVDRRDNDMRISPVSDFFHSRMSRVLETVYESARTMPRPSVFLKLFIQMELCDRTLRRWIRQREAVDLHASLLVMEQLAAGLTYLHSQNVIHRDLKPRNVFLNGEGDDVVVKIGDFGLATPDGGYNRRRCDSTDFQDSPNATLRSNVGTDAYAAPEQRSGSLYDEKVDVYSLGIIALELFHFCLTEAERDDVIGRLRDVEGAVPDSLRTSLPSVANLISKLTHHDPRLRPTASEVATAKSLGISGQEKVAILEARLRSQMSAVEDLKRLNEEQEARMREKDMEIERLRLLLNSSL